MYLLVKSVKILILSAVAAIACIVYSQSYPQPLVEKKILFKRGFNPSSTHKSAAYFETY